MTFKLTERQLEANKLLATDATHILLYGGSRSGKTALIVRAICTRAIKAPGSRHAILRFRLNAVKSAVVYDTFPKVMNLAYPGVPFSINKQEWFAELGDGSQIWFGGLDDKDRTEKILGQEYSTIFLNECSQIPYSSRNIAVTRLAQNIDTLDGRKLSLKMYYDANPPDKSHWTYRMFIQKMDPETRQLYTHPELYAAMQMNPKDNEENLPGGYLGTLQSLSGRYQRRFLHGEFRDANPNALFPDVDLDTWRVTDETLPDFQRIIIAVDPSGSGDRDNEQADEIGIMVGALGTDGVGYLLEDLTMKAGPSSWGRVVGTAYERHDADLVVAESNFGGDMVRHVIQTARPRTPFKKMIASRGKVVRAEPIAALTESGRVRLVGNFPHLEDELAGFTTNGYIGERSPNRADAFVWLFSEIFPGIVKPRKRGKLIYPNMGIV